MKRREPDEVGLAFGAGVLIVAPAARRRGALNLYSARHYNTDEALYENFTKLTGVKINRVDAEANPLVERMQAPKARTPCNVFISIDAGRIERARRWAAVTDFPPRARGRRAGAPARSRG